MKKPKKNKSFKLPKKYGKWKIEYEDFINYKKISATNESVKNRELATMCSDLEEGWEAMKGMIDGRW